MNNKTGTEKAPAKAGNPPAKANGNKVDKKKECDLKPSKRVKTHQKKVLKDV